SERPQDTCVSTTPRFHSKEEKAQRGELYASVPIGYVLRGVRLEKDPDEQVRHAVGQVFAKFREVGSARGAALALREQGVLLPARPAGRDTQPQWSAATYFRVHDVLTNPAMGGAYAWGRTRTVVRPGKDGKPRKHIAVQPRERWRVLLVDHHEGYVEWPEWLEVQERLAANSFRTGQGAPREGWALLQGLARCGICGRKMQVAYGKSAQYYCRPSVEAGSKQMCQTAGAGRVNLAVSEALLEAVQPASVEAAERAERLLAQREEERLRSYRLEVERREYEAARAEREYLKVEPEHRLVKRSLARRWESALQEVEKAREALERAEGQTSAQAVSGGEGLVGLAEDLKRLWDHPAVTMRDRKRLLAALLEEALLRQDREHRRLHVLLRWKGGCVDELEVPWGRGVPEPVRTEAETVDVVRRLARQCPDAQIARTLNRLGRRTARGLNFTARRVAQVRRSNGVEAFGRRPPPAELRSVQEAAQELGVSRPTVYRWVKQGFLVAEVDVPGAPLRVRLDDRLRERISESVPEDYVTHAQARRVLGVSRETMRQRISSGQYEARFIPRGPSRGLHVKLEPTGQASIGELLEDADEANRTGSAEEGGGED
ncbi:MAG: recombinase family protein, partial [Bryobacterales bacterium]|nr:recombinase family protein [Bryobacterales bacterium]